MLKHANRRAAPKWHDWFGGQTKNDQHVAELRSILVGERVTARAFEGLGAQELAAHANQKALAALDDLIEMGAL